MKKTKEEILARKAELARIRYNMPNSKQKQKQKEYRQKNLDAYNEYRNNYRTKNPRGIFDVIKQGALKRGIEFILNRDEFETWYNAQIKKCFYCERTEEQVLSNDSIMQIKCNRLTIDRVENNKGYEISNIVLCCKRCNAIKSNYFNKEEMLLIGKIIKNKSANN